MALQAWVAFNTRDTPVPLPRALSVWLAWAVVWAVMTPVALQLLKRWPLAGRGWVVHLVASAVCALLVNAVYAVLVPYVGATGDGGTWSATLRKLLGTTGALNVPIYWLIVGAANTMQVRHAARERERRELELVAQLGEARLQALRAQIQPHFLFNALNTIAVLMHEDVNRAHRTLLQLSHLLRRALESTATPMITLREELAFLDAYLDIETTRFEDRISYQVEVDPQLLDIQLPALILQPLVENAVHHGLTHRGRQNRITIRAVREGNHLRIEISDNGEGLSGQKDERIGLSNTRQRLDIHYGDRYRFELRPLDGGGTLALLVLPV